MEPNRKEPVAMDSMTQVDGPIHLGLDVAKNAIVVGVLLPGHEGVGCCEGRPVTRPGRRRAGR